MPESTKVFYNGSTATFRPNKTSARKGFVYDGGRRVYGRIEDSLTGRTIFVANHASEAVAQPA